ncbi:uncharacterized protein [Dermacentor andersoni]|uniref:uncharacterized protein isoform X2 n=1 Tax=Dermacentor andersoni TaxID=34620 RepID=UPI002416FA0F|nr:uncharacterized protein LOC129380632 isoform X2 [Dermacentor andersoni]
MDGRFFLLESLDSTRIVRELLSQKKSLLLGLMPLDPYKKSPYRCFNSTFVGTDGDWVYRTIFYRKLENHRWKTCKYELKFIARDGVGTALLDVAANGSEELPPTVDPRYTVIFVTNSCIILRDDKTAFSDKPIFFMWQLEQTYDYPYYDCLEVYEFISKRPGFDSRAECNNCCDSMPQIMHMTHRDCGLDMSNINVP